MAGLQGTRVLIGRAAGQQDELAARVRELGGQPVHAPLIVIEPEPLEILRPVVDELVAGSFAVLCLTSPNGVDVLADALEASGRSGGDVDVGMIACVGPGTAAALHARLGLRADLVPEVATTRALADALPAGSGRVLLPRADIASRVLTEVLEDKGYEPVDVVAYRTLRPERLSDEVLEDLTAGRIDLIAFGSSSTARNFAALVGDAPWKGRVVSIGPVTSATCREHGIEVEVEARRHDLDGLVEALVRAAK